MALLREHFHIPVSSSGEPLIYFCGNSLGLQPRAAAERVSEELEAWRSLVVDGHFRGPRPWMRFHELLAPSLARLVGAGVDEVIVMNTLTVNLHLMLASFYRPCGARTRIVIERGAFPSDRHAVVSQLQWHGLDPAEHLVELVPRAGELLLREEDIEACIAAQGERLALLLLPGVQYYTGQWLDLPRLAQAARAQGAVVGVDLAHAVGNLPLALHDWDVDFAVWCHYKYCNSGPGAIAGAFVHARHGEDLSRPRLAGWWGHEAATRFEMGPDFVPERGAAGWQVSNAPILSMAPMLAAMACFDAVGIEALRAHSLELTGRLEQRLQQRLAGRVEIITPADPARRGCQLSLRVLGGTGRAVFERLLACGVVCDWRQPDVLRAAPTPSYNTVEEVDAFVERLAAALR